MVSKLRLDGISKEELIEKYLELEKKYNKDQKKIDELEKELKKYKNAHTPSSANSHLQKNTQKASEEKTNKVGRKKGKKSGHKGKTRTPDKPTNFVDVVTDFNPSTGNCNIEPTGYVEERIITDFKITKVVTKYTVSEYRDLDTGEIFLATHSNLPEKGIFGKNVLALTNQLRFYCRVPFYRIASTFTNVFDISMTAPTTMDICKRVGDKLSPHYEQLKVQIQNEKVVYADETGAKRNGLPGWLWGFFSTAIALFKFNKKRGGDIVENTLGKAFSGVLSCDGWATYAVFSKNWGVLLQRCWAHAIREVKQICIVDGKKKNLKLERAYAWFCDIFEQVRKARKIKTKRIREKKYKKLVAELNRWIQVYWSYTKLRSVVKKIKNGRKHWFTCVLYPEVEPTNNRAEQGLRTWVVLRKIIGCLRSEEGERTTEILLSLLSTWNLRGKNPYQELRSLL